MNWILFEEEGSASLLPLTFTRPVYDLRLGIDKISEKWSAFLDAPVHTHTRSHLSALFSNTPPPSDEVWINGSVIPDASLAEAIRWLNPGTALYSTEQILLAARGELKDREPRYLKTEDFHGLETLTYQSEVIVLKDLSDIFRLNGAMIRADFPRITKGRMSALLEDKHTIVYKPEQVFIEPGVKIRAAILNAEDGPIYIGAGAEIQEGAIIHGAHALLGHSVVNMGAKLRGDSTIGPYCKVGGEVSNSVLHSYSNKGHDGFLGNSVIGSWCNLGADTNNSNLKNNYASVKLWHYPSKRFRDTGLMFCGLIMGDHSKCGINTMFNTGTVVGVGCNVFGDGFPRNVIPDFSWGGAAGFTTHALPKVFETAEKVMERRGLPLDEENRRMLEWVFQETVGKGT